MKSTKQNKIIQFLYLFFFFFCIGLECFCDVFKNFFKEKKEGEFIERCPLDFDEEQQDGSFCFFRI